MADWTTIPDTTFEPGAPAKGRDMRFLRDNPIAIAEGAAGAPRIVNAAVTNGTLGAEKFQSGTDERDWVLGRTSTASAGAVGTYAFLALADGVISGASFGVTEAGSNLSPSSASGVGSGSVSGTWRCMGRAEVGTTNTPEKVSLFMRIS